MSYMKIFVLLFFFSVVRASYDMFNRRRMLKRIAPLNQMNSLEKAHRQSNNWPAGTRRIIKFKERMRKDIKTSSRPPFFFLPYFVSREVSDESLHSRAPARPLNPSFSTPSSAWNSFRSPLASRLLR